MKKTLFVFIDASNLWQAQKSKGKLFDYKKTVQYIKEKFLATELKVFYYTAYPANGTRDYSLESRHNFFTFLKKGLGFCVRKKELKRIKIINNGKEVFQEKGNMDVELVIDAVHFINEYDAAVFFTGDSDFLALIVHLKKNKKAVYIFSSRNNISEELRTGGDAYFDILKISDDIWGKNLKFDIKKSPPEMGGDPRM